MPDEENTCQMSFLGAVGCEFSVNETTICYISAKEEDHLPSCPAAAPETAKVTCYTIIFPVVMYGCERWTIKKAEKIKNKES